MAADLVSSLRACGFYKSLEHIADLYAQAELMTANAGTGKTPAFEALISYIPSQATKTDAQPQLVIDIGGTSTKVGIKQAIQGNQNCWRLLFESDNNDIKETSVSSSGLASFATCLGNRIVESIKPLGISAEQLQACAIVWSNAFSSQPPDASGSVTGLVVQKEMYRKGEWFNRDLRNGADLGQIFRLAFQATGINISKLLVGNDTPLTMKAINAANGGMVASTGLNGTLVKALNELGQSAESKQVICNAEMGGRFFINRDFLSDFDLSGERKGSVTIEALVAGGFLPRVFVDHIIGLASMQHEELAPLANYLAGQPDNGYSFFRSEDLAGFMNDPEQLIFVKGEQDLFSSISLDTLARLATQIFSRAARLAAVVAYGTVCNQVVDNGKLVLALDSSLCRYTPVFNENFLAELQNSPAKLKNCSIETVLLEPIDTETGKISVPMQGGANALDCL